MARVSTWICVLKHSCDGLPSLGLYARSARTAPSRERVGSAGVNLHRWTALERHQWSVIGACRKRHCGNRWKAEKRHSVGRGRRRRYFFGSITSLGAISGSVTFRCFLATGHIYGNANHARDRHGNVPQLGSAEPVRMKLTRKDLGKKSRPIWRT